MSNYSHKYRDAKKDFKDKYRDITYEELLELVEKRCKTIFVGAVYKIEQNYGDLWGENELGDDDQLSPEQQSEYEKFLDLRDSIFDQGNSECKKLISEVKRFVNTQNKVQLKFEKDRDNE